MLSVGDRLPDLELRLPDERLLPLSDLRGRPVLLIFLRHLA
ncbi:MAG TPA: hypothetical protein PKD86_07585 [Gemmatales bacterium]|nr:hypothetical protein [Gemmatales bacterium]HMP59198.1 hypothetical protein [Gemmatales bacterium]